MLNKKPKVVIFDWDETLAETKKAVIEAIEFVLKFYKKEKWEIVRVKYRDTSKSFKENFPNFFGNDHEEAYNLYLKYYEENTFKFVKRANDSDSFIRKLEENNILVSIISNKEKSLLLKEIQFCFPEVHFFKIFGNGDAENNKPAPDAVFEMFNGSNIEINRENIWLIGDSKQDSECAFSANITPIIIGNGNFMSEEYIKSRLSSDKPLFLFNNFNELIQNISWM